MTAALYSLENLIQRFGGREVLSIPHLELLGRRIYVLQGPNGAGKTTLMRILAFMDPPAEGKIVFQGRNVRLEQMARYRARVVWVPQSPVMFTGTLLYNVVYPMRIKGTARGVREARAMELLQSVGLAGLAKAPAHKLSGGEAQRGSIARALAAGAEVILFDEPTASVDYRSRGEIIGIIRSLCEDRGLSILVTTHDAALAAELGQNRITLFEGKLAASAPGYSPAAAAAGPGEDIPVTRHTTAEHDAPLSVHRLHVENAGPGFAHVLQSGVQIACMTGIPLNTLLRKEFGLTEKQMDGLDVYLLDGKPVDTPGETLVPAGSRLALAAGLPGIAGLAMKSNSAVRGLRPGITHGADGQDAAALPGPGTIELVLYSLALKNLASHFLKKGFHISAAKLLELLQTGLDGLYTLDRRTVDQDSLAAVLSKLPPGAMLFLTAGARTE